MITISIHSRQRCRAFTLAEMMIGAALGSIVLAGVLSTFLMLGRSGANISNYSMMEMQSRRALEELSQDLRMASQVVYTSAQSITLTVPGLYTSLTGSPPPNLTVTYAYNSTTKVFSRQVNSDPMTTLVASVASCTFARFDRLNNPITTTVPIEPSTKRIQLTLVVRRKSQTVAAASNTILSASYILRNKLAN